MTPLCTHGCADPRMCPDCRRAARTVAPAAPVRPAAEQLVALALATRPDWCEDHVRADLAHAAAIGLTWPQALVGLARLMVDPTAQPRDLIPHHQRRTEPVDPDQAHEVAARGAQAAREVLPHRDPS